MAKSNQRLNPIEPQSERERRAYYSQRRRRKVGDLPLLDEPVIEEQPIEAPFPVPEQPVFQFANTSYPSVSEMSTLYQAQTQDEAINAQIANTVVDFTNTIAQVGFEYKFKQDDKKANEQFDLFPMQVTKGQNQISEEVTANTLLRIEKPTENVPEINVGKRFRDNGLEKFVELTDQASRRFYDNPEERQQLEAEWLLNFGPEFGVIDTDQDGQLTINDLSLEQQYTMKRQVYFGAPLASNEFGSANLTAKQRTGLQIDELKSKWESELQENVDGVIEYRKKLFDSSLIPNGTASSETYSEVWTAATTGSMPIEAIRAVGGAGTGESKVLAMDENSEFIDDGTPKRIFNVSEDGQSVTFAQPLSILLKSDQYGDRIGKLVSDQFFLRTGNPDELENFPTQFEEMAERYGSAPEQNRHLLNVILPFFHDAGPESFNQFVSQSNIDQAEKASLVYAQSLYSASFDGGIPYNPRSVVDLQERLKSKEFSDRYKFLVSSDLSGDFRNETNQVYKELYKGIKNKLVEFYVPTELAEGMDLDDFFDDVRQDPFLAGHLVTLGMIMDMDTENEVAKENAISSYLENINMYPLYDQDGQVTGIGYNNQIASGQARAFKMNNINTPQEQVQVIYKNPKELLLHGTPEQVESKTRNYFLGLSRRQINTEQYSQEWLDWASEYVQLNLRTVYSSRTDNGRAIDNQEGGIEQGDLDRFFFLSTPAVQQRLLNLDEMPSDIETIQQNFEMLSLRFGPIDSGDFVFEYASPSRTRDAGVTSTSRSSRSWNIVEVNDMTKDRPIDVRGVFASNSSNSVFQDPYAKTYKNKDADGEEVSFTKKGVEAAIANGASRVGDKGIRESFLLSFVGMSDLTDKQTMKQFDRANIDELRYLANASNRYFEDRKIEGGEERYNQIRAAASSQLASIIDRRKKERMDQPDQETTEQKVNKDVERLKKEMNEEIEMRRMEEEAARDVPKLPVPNILSEEETRLEYLRTTEGMVDSSNAARRIMKSFVKNKNKEIIFNALVDGMYSSKEAEVLLGEVSGLVDPQQFSSDAYLLSSNENIRAEFLRTVFQSFIGGTPAVQHQVHNTNLRGYLQPHRVPSNLKAATKELYEQLQSDPPSMFTGKRFTSLSDEDQMRVVKAYFKSLVIEDNNSSFSTGKFNFPPIKEEEEIRGITNIRDFPNPTRREAIPFGESELQAISAINEIPLDIEGATSLIAGGATILEAPISEMCDGSCSLNGERSDEDKQKKIDVDNLKVLTNERIDLFGELEALQGRLQAHELALQDAPNTFFLEGGEEILKSHNDSITKLEKEIEEKQKELQIKDAIVQEKTQEALSRYGNLSTETSQGVYYSFNVQPETVEFNNEAMQRLINDPDSQFSGMSPEQFRRQYYQTVGWGSASYSDLRERVYADIPEAVMILKDVLGVEIDSRRVYQMVNDTKAFNTILDGVINRTSVETDKEGSPKPILLSGRTQTGYKEYSLITKESVLEALLTMALYERYGTDFTTLAVRSKGNN